MSNGLTLSNVYPGRPNISFYLINHLVGQFKSEAFHFFIIWKGYPPLNRMKNFLIWDANLYPKPYQYPLKMTFYRQIVHVDKLSIWWGSTRCDCPFFVKKMAKTLTTLLTRLSLNLTGGMMLGCSVLYLISRCSGQLHLWYQPNLQDRQSHRQFLDVS